MSTALKPAKKTAAKVEVPPATPEELGNIVVRALTTIASLGTEFKDVPPETVVQLRTLVDSMDVSSQEAYNRATRLEGIGGALERLAGVFGDLADELEPSMPFKPQRPSKRSNARRRGY